MGSKRNNLLPILIADDDADDCSIFKEAAEESQLENKLFFVNNGEELLNYLNRKGQYSDSHRYPMPGLIFLDLNMHKKSGREALKDIKSNDQLKQIPVIVFTSSVTNEDVLKCYELGANSFVTKPATFKSFVKLFNTMGRYWFETVKLPSTINEKVKL